MSGPLTATRRPHDADALVCAGPASAPRVLATEHSRTPGDDLLGLCWLAVDGQEVAGELVIPAVPALPDPPAGAAQCGARAWIQAARGRDREATRLLAHRALGGDLFAPRLAAVRALLLADDPSCPEHLDTLVEQARGSGQRAVLDAALTVRADLLLRYGELEGATRDLSAVEDGGPRAAALRVLLAVERGQFGCADPVGTDLLYARGVQDVHAGRYADAIVHLREYGRRLTAYQKLNPALAPWRSWAATAYHVTGQPDVAAQLAGDEVVLAETWGSPSATGVAYLRAGLLAEGDQAVLWLRDATTALDASPARLRHAEAVAALRERLASSAAPAASPLSAAQRRVADLAASGLTNGDIATVLSISRRAVEMHLSNAYRRLGIAGRVELAAALGHLTDLDR